VERVLSGDDFVQTELASETGVHGGAIPAAQYLTFKCAGEEYGVDILRVQEIKGWEGVTHVPYTPHYLLGVMNLRGVIVPVIDLRSRFGLGKRDFDGSTVVIVVRVQTTQGEKTVGMVVDAVCEVYGVAQDAIKATPDLGASSDACVSGITTVESKMVLLLDIDRLIASSIECEPPRNPGS
jgi:purine-binding chemotaxis protein CheW